MDVFEVIADEFRDLPDLAEFVRITFRLVAAIVLGGLVGLERETTGKAAGLRTHMLITLGAALVMIVADRLGMAKGDQSRVIQGLVAGIGFLGGGAILKLTDERRIKGLTTAAGIWMTAMIGIAIGAGMMATAVIATALTFVVLRALHALEKRIFEAPRENA